jgi:hypothetical protein
MLPMQYTNIWMGAPMKAKCSSQLHHSNAESPKSVPLEGNSNSIERALSSKDINNAEMQDIEDGITATSQFPKYGTRDVDLVSTPK